MERAGRASMDLGKGVDMKQYGDGKGTLTAVGKSEEETRVEAGA